MMNVGLYGMDEFKSLLKDLAKTGVSTTDVNKGTRAGLKLIQKKARKNLKRNKNIRTKLLYKSIKVRVLNRAEKRKSGFVAGTKTGVFASAYHAHLIEYGTSVRFRKTKTGKRVTTGSVTAKPFLRPAFTSEYRNAYDSFVKTFSPLLQNRINGFVRRHNSRRAA
jgi:HK97 gp10 family phage protein